MAQYRQERLSHEIQRIVSEMMQFELRDPRIHMASVTRVEVSGDMRHAKVYISAVTEEDREEAAQVLQRARGFLRKGVASRLSMRVTPELHILPDKAIVGGDHVLAMIRDLAEPVDGHGG
ncbi:MAG TPA: 30S ribosome-binding factor RbfA [Chloroflexota bacterium]|nr:30S ribosome-binding factor RbfA [Chloroflexota bacterium]